MTHLDTSFLIRALVAGSPEDRALRGWLRRGEPVGISAVGWAEFLCGPVAEDDVVLAAGLLGEPLAFDGAAATITADLFNSGGRRRGTLTDCMIAASAIRADARLATSNPRDFARLEGAGLKLAARPAAGA